MSRKGRIHPDAPDVVWDDRLQTGRADYPMIKEGKCNNCGKTTDQFYPTFGIWCCSVECANVVDDEYKKAMETGQKIRELVTSVDPEVIDVDDEEKEQIRKLVQSVKDDYEEFEKMAADLLTGKEELPHTCDFCNFFSGNEPNMAGQRPAKCLNKASEFYASEVEEDNTCGDGDWDL